MKFIKSLYFWILCAFILGIGFGFASPQQAILMEPLGTNFIKLLKVFICPIVFFTIVTGIAQTGCAKKLGKVGLKAFIYFEIVSTLALIAGWTAASITKPGESVHADVSTLDAKPIEKFLHKSENLNFIDYLQNLIPSSIVEPFIKGDILQILILAIFFGIGLLFVDKKHSDKILTFLEIITKCLFQALRIAMYFAPLGVFGAMAFTIGKFGSQMLLPLLSLIGTFYVTGFIFVFIVLGLIALWAGFSIFKFLRYIAPELFLVLATSSSETALPQLLQKLEKLGCTRETAGVVVPMGYSFNLDGTNIYITLAALFIAQALGVNLSFAQEFAIFAIAMLTSKGAAGVTGSGFITLAATLSVVPAVPAIGIVLILGIDRFMSEARAIVNYIGNGVAALVVARMEKELTSSELKRNLDMALY